MNMSGWVADQKAQENVVPSSMTIAQFEGIIQSLKDQRAVADQAKEAYEAEVQKCEDIESRIVQCLEEMGRTNYKAKVGTVSITHRTSFKLPASPDEWQQYFKYLRDREMYDAMVTVNSQKHNSFCKAEMEAAHETGQGLDFKIPGVLEPTISKTLSFRKV